MSKLEQIRKNEAIFDASANVYTYDVHDTAILGIMREKDGEKFYSFYNFSDQERTAWMYEEGEYANLITGEKVELKDIRIPAHDFIWAMTARDKVEVEETVVEPFEEKKEPVKPVSVPNKNKKARNVSKRRAAKKHNKAK